MSQRLHRGNVFLLHRWRQLRCLFLRRRLKTVVPAQSDSFSVTAGDFDLLEEFQNAVPVANAENSDRHPGSEPPEMPLQSSHTFGHDTTVVSFPHSPIGEDGVPTSADYSQGVDLPEPDPNVFKWLETNQGMQSHGRCYLRANR